MFNMPDYANNLFRAMTGVADAVHDVTVEQCPICGGSGRTHVYQGTEILSVLPCSWCGGTGKTSVEKVNVDKVTL